MNTNEIHVTFSKNDEDDVCLYIYDITHKQTILTQQKDKLIITIVKTSIKSYSIENLLYEWFKKNLSLLLQIS